ncbi:MAG: hypothetical protein WC455_28440 [Dehalococcoidia bacterium]|jgi:hypothetical protein
MNLSNYAKISTALDYASGSADREGAALDMSGFEGVLMIVKFATIAASAVVTIKAQQGDESDLSDAADLEDTGISVAEDDDDQVFIIDLYRPLERYVRLYVDKDASNATAESAIYVQYGARSLPADNNVDDEVTCELHVSPDEGTA